MLSVADGDNALQSRLPLLLSVAEGMLEVNLSQLDNLQSKNLTNETKVENSPSLKEGITQQQKFAKAARLHCKKLGEIFLGRRQSQELRKLENCLKDLTEVHLQLLENL